MLSFRGRSKRLECYRVAMKHHEIHTCLLPQSVGSLRCATHACQTLVRVNVNLRQNNIQDTALGNTTADVLFAACARHTCIPVCTAHYPQCEPTHRFNRGRRSCLCSAFINALCAVHSACAVVQQRHVCPLHTPTSNVQLSQQVPHDLPVMSCRFRSVPTQLCVYMFAVRVKIVPRRFASKCCCC